MELVKNGHGTDNKIKNTCSCSGYRCYVAVGSKLKIPIKIRRFTLNAISENQMANSLFLLDGSIASVLGVTGCCC